MRLLDELDQRGASFCDIKLFLKDFSGLFSADPSETAKRFLDSSAFRCTRSIWKGSIAFGLTGETYPSF